MVGVPRTAEMKRLVDLVKQIPAGHVTTLGILAQAMRLPPRRIAHLLSLLDGDARAGLPWWRVVADGGAIGRHPHRAEQIERLRADGVPVAPVGIVRELVERRWAVFGETARAGAAQGQPVEPVPAPRSRARATKNHPPKP